MKIGTRKLVTVAVIAALYAGLTMLIAPISYGTLQFRVSEVLCILPFFFPASAIGLTLGCAIANLMSAAGILDIIFGSLATLLAGLCTAAIGIHARKKVPVGEVKEKIGMGSSIAACAMPVLFNAPIVGAVLSFALTPAAFWEGVLIFGAQVGIGEAGVMFVLGLPLMRYAMKHTIFLEKLQ
ncbi:MAG: QueT transporter family protein [Oscillospiraceae bacterium]